ncbi:hypothetical protein D8674_017240 [Pyrus ussuriensis x Pyrus communis]|uniref:Uncharacterized protein n=1 Tax=Pyrus ussuriensis x Pyrus communis TaxID=2448454 RepID=A0A5N5HJA5_9ROSA|nr:hypothetical protein D8674_017240 [Pyrus ussuriensis x Pyrus communis]
MHPTVAKATIPFTLNLSRVPLICMALASFPIIVSLHRQTPYTLFIHTPPPPPSLIIHQLYVLSLLIVRKQCCPFNKMDTGSVLLFLAVAAIIFFCPLIMGPLNPPALPLMVAFAMVLGTVWIALNHTSK